MLTLAVVFLLQVVPQTASRADTLRVRADSLAADTSRARRAHRLEGLLVTAIRGRAAQISRR